MRWACILLPQLALDHALRQRDDPQTPLALLSGPANRRVLQALNPAARELGLRHATVRTVPIVQLCILARFQAQSVQHAGASGIGL